MYVQVARAQLCANHLQHIECLSRASVMPRATWYEGTAQLLSLTELKSHIFELYFIGWTIKPMKEGRKPEYPEKTPGDELQTMPHTTAQRFKPQTRLEPVQQHWWQARKADMRTITPRVAASVRIQTNKLYYCSPRLSWQTNLRLDEAYHLGFSLGTPLSSPPSLVNGFSQ